MKNNTEYKIGDKVVFTQTIERYPFAIVDVGDTGTIVEFEEANSDRANDPLVLIKMDNEQIVKDLAEWEGVLYLSNTPTTDGEHDYEGLDVIELAQKPALELSGKDGNAFMILGTARRVAKKAGWSKEKIDTVFAEATSGDYDHVLQTMMKYFDVK